MKKGVECGSVGAWGRVFVLVVRQGEVEDENENEDEDDDEDRDEWGEAGRI